MTEVDLPTSGDPVLDGVLADLAAETAALDGVVANLTAEQWRTPTPAEGWDVAHQIVHLAWTDEAAVQAAAAGRGEKDGWDALILQALEDPTGFVDAVAAEGAQQDPEAILARWRAARMPLWEVLAGYPAGEKLPWFGPPMSPTSMASARFMETWAHALDVYDALGVEAAPTDRVRHVVHIGVRTRGYSFANNGLEAPSEPVRLELTLPSGASWTDGPEDAADRVSGSAYDFALRVTQRRHLDDLDLDVTGAVSTKWMEIAQAFAGPPGAGREALGGAS